MQIIMAFCMTALASPLTAPMTIKARPAAKSANDIILRFFIHHRLYNIYPFLFALCAVNHRYEPALGILKLRRGHRIYALEHGFYHALAGNNVGKIASRAVKHLLGAEHHIGILRHRVRREADYPEAASLVFLCQF